MQKLTGKIIASYLTNSILVAVLAFSAIYFFVGNNLVYMSKTQQQINTEFIGMANYMIEKKDGSIKADDLMRYATDNNLGIRMRMPDGSLINSTLTEQQLVLRLEFGGRMETQEAELTNGDIVSISFYEPYLSDMNTLKFKPAFFRLALILFGLGFLLALFSAVANAAIVKNELKRVSELISNLLKGSYQNPAINTQTEEFREVMDKLSAVRELVLKKDALKKRMTSDFAHELRTPLTTLQSHLEALIDGVWEPSIERFASCHEEILRLIRLVGDLEKLNKIEDEDAPLNKTRFDLTELISTLSINFEGEMKKNNINLILSGESQLVVADRDKLSQVVVNLLSNSLKYTPAGGAILFSVKEDDNYVYLVVNDSGVGIPNKDVPHVFNRLYRSDNSRARTSGGAGIGLTIAKSIIEAHEGSIDIVSQVGMGTEVTIILPRGF